MRCDSEGQTCEECAASKGLGKAAIYDSRNHHPLFKGAPFVPVPETIYDGGTNAKPAYGNAIPLEYDNTRLPLVLSDYVSFA